MRRGSAPHEDAVNTVGPGRLSRRLGIEVVAFILLKQTAEAGAPALLFLAYAAHLCGRAAGNRGAGAPASLLFSGSTSAKPGSAFAKVWEALR
jgi:hypothetical protein